MQIIVRCLPQDDWIKAINTAYNVEVIYVKIEPLYIMNFFIFDLGKKFKIMNIHFKAKLATKSKLVCIATNILQLG